MEVLRPRSGDLRGRCATLLVGDVVRTGDLEYAEDLEMTRRVATVAVVSVYPSSKDGDPTFGTRAGPGAGCAPEGRSVGYARRLSPERVMRGDCRRAVGA